jgi:CIC family chloride channel protein
VLLLSALTGMITGAVIAGFDYVVDGTLLGWVESWPLWAQALAPAVGLSGAGITLLTLGRGASPEMSDEYIRNFHDSHHRLDRRPVIGRMVASAFTLGFGGTMGFEGPSIYTGAAIGATVQSLLRRFFSREDAKILMVAGAAAGLAAIFKAPATGAVFAIEVPYQDDLAGSFVLPALCASAVGYATYVAFRSTSPLLPVAGSAPFDLLDLGGAVVVGLACGLGARVFTWGLELTKRIAQRGLLPVRIGVAGAILATLAVASQRLTGAALTEGPGYRAASWALDSRQVLTAVALLLVLRAVAVLATVVGGGAGGLFIPLVVEGALLGRILGTAFGVSGSLFPVLGIAAFLAAGYRCPLTAVMFVAETTGRPGFVVPGLLAAVVAHLVMGRQSGAPDQLSVRAGHLEHRFRLPVTAALATNAPTVPPNLTIAGFLQDYVVARHAVVAPVVDGAAVLGVISVADAENIPREDRAGTRVIDVMHPDHPVGTITWSLRDALMVMGSAEVDVLPIVDGDGNYQGLLSVAGILALKDVLDEADDYGPSGVVRPWTPPLPAETDSDGDGEESNGPRPGASRRRWAHGRERHVDDSEG